MAKKIIDLAAVHADWKAFNQHLEAAFADFDAENLAKSQAWAKGRVAALKEFKSSAEYTAITDAWTRYDHLFRIAGGKGWYLMFNGSNDAMIEEAITKNSAAIAEKRNATIIAKLKKIGVTDLGGLQYSRTNDGGFNGTFNFEGASIEIRTIVAGGYNIQCLHERTLVYANGKRA